MITMTETAKQALVKYLAEDESSEAGLRVYITPGGCSGFSYGMVLEDQTDPSDEIFEHDGVRLIIDRFSASMLDGAEIDYVESLMGAGFSVSNPNATTTCGCGHSFRTAGSAGSSQSCH